MRLDAGRCDRSGDQLDLRSDNLCRGLCSARRGDEEKEKEEEGARKAGGATDTGITTSEDGADGTACEATIRHHAAAR